MGWCAKAVAFSFTAIRNPSASVLELSAAVRLPTYVAWAPARPRSTVRTIREHVRRRARVCLATATLLIAVAGTIALWPPDAGKPVLRRWNVQRFRAIPPRVRVPLSNTAESNAGTVACSADSPKACSVRTSHCCDSECVPLAVACDERAYDISCDSTDDCRGAVCCMEPGGTRCVGVGQCSGPRHWRVCGSKVDCGDGESCIHGHCAPVGGTVIRGGHLKLNPPTQ
jgi:hypothetical protein